MSDLPVLEISAEPPAPTQSESPQPPPVRPVVWLALAAAVAILVGSVFVPGEVGAFLAASWTTTPMMFLCVAAYLGIDRRWARWTAIALLVGLVGLAALVSLFILVIAHFGSPDGFLELGHVAGGIGLICIATISPITALPLVRRLHSGQRAFVTRVAIIFSLPMAGLMLAPLIFLNEPPLLMLTEMMLESGEDPEGARGVAGAVLDSVYGLFWTLPAAVFAVGYGVRRTFVEALDRLGLKMPTRSTSITAAVAIVALLVGVWLIDLVVVWVWARFGWPVTDERLVDALFAHATSVAGALSVGVAAGLGEEVVVRGILQPRVGIILSNLFFTAAHAFQYHWDALVQVLLIGLVLGVIRRRTDTTTTAMIHAGYDVVLLAGSGFLESA